MLHRQCPFQIVCMHACRLTMLQTAPAIAEALAGHGPESSLNSKASWWPSSALAWHCTVVCARLTTFTPHKGACCFCYFCRGKCNQAMQQRSAFSMNPKWSVRFYLLVSTLYFFICPALLALCGDLCVSCKALHLHALSNWCSATLQPMLT